MVLDKSIPGSRVNTRKTDAFDIFNFKHYDGPNPYLNWGALVFDFTSSGYGEPLPLEDYVAAVCDRYPSLQTETFSSYAELFARALVEVNKLEMHVHLNHWSVQTKEKVSTLAIQSMYGRTSRAAAYLVWDWFEAITLNEKFRLTEQIEELQEQFRRSVYGGPTTYALLRTAYEKGIPTFYLWDESLVQYGYGKKKVCGTATTFDSDSHLDSNFTTRKDDCKTFMSTLGFPVPKGEIVVSYQEALAAAKQIGYPVAVKPVVGHKGIGVTAGVQDELDLEAAFKRAVRAIPDTEPIQVIVERSLSGADFRLLCVNGRFVAATERRPASVTGDGRSTIQTLIERENRQPARIDTPTSALGKIICDEAMELYLAEQGLSLDSVLRSEQTVYLRKVANLSAGGLSIDATHTIHPDNVILAQDIAQHFRLTCLGIDVMAESLAKSWKESNLGIIEINAAPGIFMHLNPAIGDSIDVTSHILGTFFETGSDARIPIVTFNQVTVRELQEMIDEILSHHPSWTVGAVCRDGIFVNRSEKVLHRDYNTNIQNLLRNPQLDLLIAEYDHDTFIDYGMFYQGSDVVILDNPTSVEMVLARDVFDHSIIVTKQQNTVSIRRSGLIEQYELGEEEPFKRVYLKELAIKLGAT